MGEENKQIGAKTQKVALKNLYLDPNNFRLVHEPEQINVKDEKVKDPDVARRTFRLIIGDRNQNITDLIDSFKANGYLSVDQIQVRILSDGGYIVVEGNRRVATLKYLQSEYDEKGIELGQLDPALFSKVPVVLYEDPDEIHHLTIMALNHIGGKKKWPEWNQAMLLERMVNQFHLSEDDVFKRVGISKTELRRVLRALALANQYRASDYGDQFSESQFPIFREVARNVPVKEWLGCHETTYLAENLQNRELFFSWLSNEPIEEDDNDDDSKYSSNSRVREPAISRRDDINLLAKIISDPIAMQKLRDSRNIVLASQSSNLIFQEKIDNALKSVVTDISTLSQLAVTQDQVPELDIALGKLRTIVAKAKGNSLKGVEGDSVYYDRIDSHFTSINIRKYRCLNNFKINNLSRINIFAGVNNSGKTSLLEAIYLLCKQNDFNGLIDVQRRRGKIPEDNISPRWLTEQLAASIEVEGVFDGKVGTVIIEPFIEDGSIIDRARYLKSIEITTQYGAFQGESNTQIFEGRDRVTQANSIKLLCRSVFSSPFFFNEPHHYSGYYYKSVQSKLLPRIEQFLREKVLPTTKRVNLTDELQRFLVDDDRFQKAMDLTSYGEGFQRIFFTSLLFASAQGGVLLIDEFENAIHADLLDIFVPFINDLSKEFNTQVFLTSHSKECIDAFVKTIPSENIVDFTFHALVRNETKKVEIREFEGLDFSKILKAGDVDLRRAQ
jgi:AAA domain, putative AbiEii toxin, Type IV TA system